jgi:hypothetical protein
LTSRCTIPRRCATASPSQDLDGPLDRFGRREGTPAVEHLSQRCAVKALHDKERPTLRRTPKIADRYEIRRLDRGEGLRLDAEAVRVPRIVGDGLVQELDNNGLFQSYVDRLVDLPHPAKSETPDGRVLSAGERVPLRRGGYQLDLGGLRLLPSGGCQLGLGLTTGGVRGHLQTHFRTLSETRTWKMNASIQFFRTHGVPHTCMRAADRCLGREGAQKLITCSGAI